MALRTDYKDDVLNTALNTERQFSEVTNPNGTKSFRDVTEYTQVGDEFGAAMVNAQNAEINAKAPLASPVFTGNPTAPTPSVETADDTIATTAYVRAYSQQQLFSLYIDENGHLIYDRTDDLTTINFEIVNNKTLEVIVE